MARPLISAVSFRTLVVLTVTGVLLCLPCAAGTQPSPAHQRSFWREVAKNDFAFPQQESASALADELNNYLASPDPELRDDFAYTILGTWIGRGVLPPAQMTSFAQQWRANLKAHIGESGTDSVFRRTFSALLLAEVVKRDSQAPFLGRERFRSTLDAALLYLREERDLRGYNESTGWAHATAHTADLLKACAAHPQFTREDQSRVLDAISERLASAEQVYTHGEQDRLAQAVAVMPQRDDFDLGAFAAWTMRLRRQADEAFATSPVRSAALVRRENSLQVLRALFVRLSLLPESEARKRAADAVLAALGRRPLQP